MSINIKLTRRVWARWRPFRMALSPSHPLHPLVVQATMHYIVSNPTKNLRSSVIGVAVGSCGVAAEIVIIIIPGRSRGGFLWRPDGEGEWNRVSCEWIIMIMIVKLLLFCHHRKNPDYDDYHGQAACVLVVTNVYREGGGDIAGLRSTHTQTRANYQHHHHQDRFQQNYFLKQVKGCSTFCFHIIWPYYHQFFCHCWSQNSQKHLITAEAELGTPVTKKSNRQDISWSWKWRERIRPNTSSGWLPRKWKLVDWSF